MPNSKPFDATLRLIVESYHRLTNKPLIPIVPSDANALRAVLWEDPRAIVAHGTEADPIFFYGNRAALQWFEMTAEEFAQLPSRLSAELMAQEARVMLLEKVTQQGYVEGYSGMRIAKSGRRFMISDVTVWNLLDDSGGNHGQAAVFVRGVD